MLSSISAAELLQTLVSDAPYVAAQRAVVGRFLRAAGCGNTRCVVYVDGDARGFEWLGSEAVLRGRVRLVGGKVSIEDPEATTGTGPGKPPGGTSEALPEPPQGVGASIPNPPPHPSGEVHLETLHREALVLHLTPLRGLTPQDQDEARSTAARLALALRG